MNRQGIQLCHPQRRVWFTEVMYPGTGVGNLAGCLLFPGTASQLSLLERAVNHVIKSHDALRLRLLRTGDLMPRQIVVDFESVTLQQVQSTKENTALREEAKRPFSMIDGPLFDFKLLVSKADQIGVFFRYHHIIVDALTVSLLNKRIFESFKALASNRQPTEFNAPTFDEFLKREKAYLKSDEFMADKAFWSAEIADMAPDLEHVSNPSSIATKRYEHTFSRHLTDEISKLCHDNHTTIFRFFMAIFALFFSAPARRREIVLSTGHHNRIHSKDMQMAGMTVSTVPVRLVFDEQISFAKHLKEAHRKIKDCLSHQQYPYDLLAEQLRLGGHDPKRLLRYFINHIPAFEGEYKVERYSPGGDLAELNIKINPNQRPKDDLLQICVDARVEIFDSAAVLKMFENLNQLIEAVVANPDRRLDDLTMIPSVQQRTLIEPSVAAQSLPAVVPKETVWDLFEKVARGNPNRTALVDEHGTYTYGALLAESQRLAAVIIRRGTSSGSIIPIVMPRNTSFVIAALAVFRAGCAYVPIEPETPTERMDYIINDVSAEFVLASAPGLIGKISKDVITVPTEENCSEISRPTPRGELIAYVIYTSGTSGSPHGVMVPHGGLSNLCHWNKDICSLDKDDVTAAYCSFMFDVSVAEIFTPLICGAAVHILPERIRHSVFELNRYFIKHKVATATLPTKVGELFIQNIKETSLKVLTVAGEQLRVFSNRPYQIINAYGPTEATVFATAYRVLGAEPKIPIGRPAHNMVAYVVDRHHHLVPPGEEGELLLAGPQLAAGYLNASKLTAKRFIENPFSSSPGLGRAYKTGDRVRMRADGNLEFLGRMDRQIKRRGFRIEPGEIEKFLCEHPTVTQCHVMKDAQETLCAFYVTKPGQSLDAADLHAYLQSRLPRHLLPDQFIKIDEIPLDRNGKTNSLALLHRAKQTHQNHLASRVETSTERLLVTIWREILGIENVALSGDFFELGGDSLKAMRLLARLEDLTASAYPMSLIFEFRTIKQLAAALDKDKNSLAPAKTQEGMTTIRNGADPRPLFCIHDITGTVMPYFNIAAHIDGALTMQGIVYNHKIGSQRSVKTLAKHYTSIVQRAQPSGPLKILGYSVGSIIAYEMAQQLTADGRRIDFLGIIDTPNFAAQTRSAQLFSVTAFTSILSWLRNMSLLYKFNFIKSDLHKRLKRGNLRSMFFAQRNMKAMIMDYQPKPYLGELTIFRANRRILGGDDLGWKPLVQNLVLHKIDGDHVSILAEKNASQVALALLKSLL